MPAPNLTSLAEVARIAGMADPVARNYQITQSYHEISRAMSQRLGPVANWCTFATWASRQAGQTIRGEDFSKALKERLAAVPAIRASIEAIAQAAMLKGSTLGQTGIVKLIWEIVDPAAAMKRAGGAVARGNQKVYAEIAHEFARFLEACMGDRAYDAEKITRFCAQLRPGGPPSGQQYLGQAFSRYYLALFEKDEKQRAELILLANLECGFHEQTRLQPEIKEAMEAAVLDGPLFKGKLLKALFPRQYWVQEIGSLFSALFNRPTPLDVAIEKFTHETRRHLRLFLTTQFMELGFPQGVRLYLGKDLRANFPSYLQQLTFPDLMVFLKKIDPTPDSLSETGTIDWADLNDRLHYICDLFRCYHAKEELLGPPFEDFAEVG
jgi:hypothetical protein